MKIKDYIQSINTTADKIYNHFWSLSILLDNFKSITREQAIKYAIDYDKFYLQESIGDNIEFLERKYNHKSYAIHDKDKYHWYKIKDYKTFLYLSDGER